MADIEVRELSPEEKRRVRARNWALGLTLVALVVLFYVITLVKGVAMLGRTI